MDKEIAKKYLKEEWKVESPDEIIDALSDDVLAAFVESQQAFEQSMESAKRASILHEIVRNKIKLAAHKKGKPTDNLVLKWDGDTVVIANDPNFANSTLAKLKEELFNCKSAAASRN